MPIFKYKGLDQKGRNMRGQIDAENVRVAQLQLKKKDIFVTDIVDKEKNKRKSQSSQLKFLPSVSIKDLSIMTRQLATLLKANIPLVDSLAAVADQVENSTLSEIISEVKERVNEGISFHQALAKHPKVFNQIFISMCEAGEMSGNLDTILVRLAELTESGNELKNKLISALLYPCMMLLVALATCIFLFVVVVPQIRDIFLSFPKLVLPWYTKMFFLIGDIIFEYWPALIFFFVCIVFGFVSWKRTESGRQIWDQIKLKFPIIGPLIRMVAVARFARVLSSLLQGGVPMLMALNLVKNVVNNKALSQAIAEARDNISEGESISGPLKKSKQFPPVVIHMVSIGEKTGELEHMLTQLSVSYEAQTKTRIEGLSRLLEPLMMVFMGGIIGFIAFSILIPLTKLSEIGGI